MNCCDSFGNCTQGRDCPIRKEQSLKERDLFWDVMEGFIILSVITGIVTSLCLMFGYIWFQVTP